LQFVTFLKIHMMNISQSYWSQSRLALQLRLLLHQNDAAPAQKHFLEASKNAILLQRLCFLQCCGAASF
jgi:hypothetical protein